MRKVQWGPDDRRRLANLNFRELFRSHGWELAASCCRQTLQT